MKNEILAFDMEELKSKMKENNITHLSQISNAASKVLSNHGGIAILINSSGDGLFYQYYNNDIKEVEIEYFHKDELDDEYDYIENDEMYPGFIMKNDKYIYLLQDFLRNDR